MRRRAKGGFTLIELLVVIAIIGILASIVLASLNSARQKARDARRVADIKSIQLALEIYFDTCNGYPEQASGVLATASKYGTCASTFAEALSAVPANPLPNGADYLYCGTTSAAKTTCTAAGAGTSDYYKLTFTLEKKTGSLDTGAHTASPAGIE